jgi:glycosyltransferase involved in cell wall biosynthesis
MYPSRKHKTFGVFVQNVEKILLNDGNDVIKAVIRGQGTSFVQKIYKYILFYLSITYNFFFVKYDLIYVHYINSSFVPLSLFSFLKKPKRLIINFHGGDLVPLSRYENFVMPLTKFVVRKSVGFVVPSEYFSELLQSYHGVSKSKICVYPSGGIDTNSFYKFSGSRAEVITIGFVSRVARGKGWDTFIKFLRILKDRGISFKAKIAGNGPDMPKLLSMIDFQGFGDSVEVLGEVSHKDLPGLFNSFHVFVFPTKLSESLGLVGLEAMACGVPVIGSNIGGIKSYIIDEYNGYLFTPGDEQELFYKFEKYIALSQIERDGMEEAGIQTAIGYDSKTTSVYLTNFFRQLLD